MYDDYDALLAPIFNNVERGATLQQALKTFAERDLVSLAGLALSSEGILRRIQLASFRHPNGFERIVLRRDKSTKRALRLHLWAEPDNCSSQDIHNHAWGFASHAIAGTFRHSTFVFEHDPGAVTGLYRFADGASDRYRYQLIKRGRAKLVSAEMVKAGDSFLMEASTLHTFMPLESGGKTLVFHYPEAGRRSSEMVRITTKQEAGEDPSLQKYTIEEIESILNQVATGSMKSRRATVS